MASSEEMAFADVMNLFDEWKREMNIIETYKNEGIDVLEPSDNEKRWFSELEYIHKQYHDKFGIYEPRK